MWCELMFLRGSRLQAGYSADYEGFSNCSLSEDIQGQSAIYALQPKNQE